MLSEAKIAKKKNEKKIGSFKLGKQNFLKLAIKMKNAKRENDWRRNIW